MSISIKKNRKKLKKVVDKPLKGDIIVNVAARDNTETTAIT